jgi:hypothetical protein
MPELTALLTEALTDPFRVVLLIGLVLTQRRTAAATGTVLPLALGCIFVAVLLPMTMKFGAGAGLPKAIGAGLIANVILLAPILLAAYLWDRRSR